MATSTRQVRRSRAQWQSLIERAGRSPLSVTAFCQTEGVSTASFYAWRKRITGTMPQPAPVSDRAAAPPGPATGAAVPFLDLGALVNAGLEGSHWDVELALGAGVVLRLRRI